MNILRYYLLLVIFSGMTGCEKEETVPDNIGAGSGNAGSGNGKTVFWISSDLACGNIDVTCNGRRETINRYYSSGAPACGASGCATFELEPGTYPYTATCSNWSWNGSVTVKSGNCVSMELTAGGGNNSGSNNGSGGGSGSGSGSGGNSSTGQAIVWVGYLGGGSIKVEVSTNSGPGGTRKVHATSFITSAYTDRTGPPPCGAYGSANFDLAPGTYRFSAMLGAPGDSDYQTWSGGFTVVAGKCVRTRIH